ncbi:hypothetical protein B0H14DRAFT_2628663 [Mycena olivaceomarginata]|nr:hypothetical protein B0H14DRAFT_2628663 [Mycena olivaceomarginata]
MLMFLAVAPTVTVGLPETHPKGAFILPPSKQINPRLPPFSWVSRGRLKDALVWRRFLGSFLGIPIALRPGDQRLSDEARNKHCDSPPGPPCSLRIAGGDTGTSMLRLFFIMNRVQFFCPRRDFVGYSHVLSRRAHWLSMRLKMKLGITRFRVGGGLALLGPQSSACLGLSLLVRGYDREGARGGKLPGVSEPTYEGANTGFGLRMGTLYVPTTLTKSTLGIFVETHWSPSGPLARHKVGSDMWRKDKKQNKREIV